MKKYRIIKKQNFKFGNKIYPELYTVEVKTFIFWDYLIWYSGTDISSDEFWFNDLHVGGKSRPLPIHETEKKFGDLLKSGSGTYVVSTDYDTIKFFVDKVIELDKYMQDQKYFEKHNETKTVDVIYVDPEPKKTEEPKEEPQKTETNVNIIDL